MSVTEEQVTIALANRLDQDGWRVVAVHPPEGQGPFVIPKEALARSIERSSYHPDVVAIRTDGHLGPRILLAECKVHSGELRGDWEKLAALSESRDALLFALFRCKDHPHAIHSGVDFDQASGQETSELPVEFASACVGDFDRSDVADSASFPAIETMVAFRCWHFEFALD